jgi:hypothetical protein
VCQSTSQKCANPIAALVEVIDVMKQIAPNFRFLPTINSRLGYMRASVPSLHDRPVFGRATARRLNVQARSDPSDRIRRQR